MANSEFIKTVISITNIHTLTYLLIFPHNGSPGIRLSCFMYSSTNLFADYNVKKIYTAYCAEHTSLKSREVSKTGLPLTTFFVQSEFFHFAEITCTLAWRGVGQKAIAILAWYLRWCHWNHWNFQCPLQLCLWLLFAPVRKYKNYCNKVNTSNWWKGVLN